jgi:hypothetical protein
MHINLETGQVLAEQINNPEYQLYFTKDFSIHVSDLKFDPISIARNSNPTLSKNFLKYVIEQLRFVISILEEIILLTGNTTL